MSAELLAGGGGVLAAFLAGAVALFAPCCLVFLAPSYLAAAVKSRRARLLPLTFVFAAGVALVLVPVTMGMSLLAGAIARYHAPLYYAGGVLMLALAALALSGRMWALPAFVRAPDAARGDSAAFFALGVFSGVASSCCAPVLAGVMTLSALAGSAWGGLALGLAYVFGMVVPLFVMALAWDRWDLAHRRWHARAVQVDLGPVHVATNTLNVGVAAAFAAMAGGVFWLAGQPRMTGGLAPFQREVGDGLTGALLAVERALAPVPEWLLGAGLLALAGAFVWATLRPRRPAARTGEAGAQERKAALAGTDERGAR